MCGSKNGYQKDIFLKRIGLRAQNRMTVLNSIVNIIGCGGGGDVYDDSMCMKKKFTLNLNE